MLTTCPFFIPLSSGGMYLNTIGCCISTEFSSVVCRHHTFFFSPLSRTSATLRPAYSLLLARLPPVIRISRCPSRNSSSTSSHTLGRYPYRHGSACSSSISWLRLNRYSLTASGSAWLSS